MIDVGFVKERMDNDSQCLGSKIEMNRNKKSTKPFPFSPEKRKLRKEQQKKRARGQPRYRKKGQEQTENMAKRFARVYHVGISTTRPV